MSENGPALVLCQSCKSTPGRVKDRLDEPSRNKMVHNWISKQEGTCRDNGNSRCVPDKKPFIARTKLVYCKYILVGLVGRSLQ